MNEMARKKKESTPGEKLAKQTAKKDVHIPVC